MTTDDTLLTSDNHALLLIDHQYLQLLAVRSHSNDTIVNNTVMLAKGGKIFGVPTLFTTAFAERQDLIKEIQAVHPHQVPIDRTGLNSWDDERVRDWVQASGQKKLVMAGLWTEVCLTMPVLSALAEGHEVYIVTDASGSCSVEGHERAVQRMMQAGAHPLTVASYVSELQRDWGRTETELSTHCPYKGDATYFSIPSAGDGATNIAWSYEAPYEAVAEISGHIAFYLDRVVTVEEWETGNRQ